MSLKTNIIGLFTNNIFKIFLGYCLIALIIIASVFLFVNFSFAELPLEEQIKQIGIDIQKNSNDYIYKQGKIDANYIQIENLYRNNETLQAEQTALNKQNNELREKIKQLKNNNSDIQDIENDIDVKKKWPID